MYITPITNYSFQGNLSPVRIITRSKNNRKHPYLYNEVMDLVKRRGISANFHTDRIDFPDPTPNAIAELKSLKIKFRTIKNI
jgi:hypothetical protein